jgi:hypothetical protein
MFVSHFPRFFNFLAIMEVLECAFIIFYYVSVFEAVSLTSTSVDPVGFYRKQGKERKKERKKKFIFMCFIFLIEKVSLLALWALDITTITC